MRVLWMCAFAPAVIAKAQGETQNNFGGWIDGALKGVAEAEGLSLAVCYPQREKEDTITGSVHGIRYYGVYVNRPDYSYDPSLTSVYEEIIKMFDPDAIHIWGVEFPYYYSMVEAVKNRVPIICSIQGLCGFIEKHYYSNLPMDVVREYTFRDRIRRDNIVDQREKFIKRGEVERRILERADHVIGRTDWDKACTQIFAKQAEYHFCNEVLRDVFYETADSWDYESCEKHSVFVSQASYPIKGFHNVIEALHILLKDYPDAVLYSTGDSPFQIPWFRLNSYQRYIRNLIDEYRLRDKVLFVGSLTASEMCNRYCKSNAFVSASSIENSPNSVGEAMMLGMPVVASYVGGTMNLLRDKEEGFLYQADAPYMLAYYLKILFDEGTLAKERGHRAYLHASETHSQRKNTKQLLDIYHEVLNGE